MAPFNERLRELRDCARLALILHCLRLAVGEIDTEDVDGESVVRAARLIRYFQSHARKVYAALDADERIVAARKVLRWLKRERRETFTRRDAHHALEGTFHTAEELDRPLEVLTQRNYVRPAIPVSRPGPGRKPSQVYEVNPATLTTQSTQSTK